MNVGSWTSSFKAWEEWNVDYYFSLTGKMKDMTWPFWEHMRLDLKGKFLQPKELLGRDTEATILADRRYTHVLEYPTEPTQEPKAIGGLTLRGKNPSLSVGA